MKRSSLDTFKANVKQATEVAIVDWEKKLPEVINQTLNQAVKKAIAAHTGMEIDLWDRLAFNRYLPGTSEESTLYTAAREAARAMAVEIKQGIDIKLTEAEHKALVKGYRQELVECLREFLREEAVTQAGKMVKEIAEEAAGGGLGDGN